MSAELRHAAVIGGGTMGLGIARVLAMAGLHVTLASSSPSRTRQSLERLRQTTDEQIKAGLHPQTARDDIARIDPADTPEEAGADADIVFEAVPEDLELKKALLRDLSRVAPQEAVLTTNTSSFPINTLAAAVNEPQRFLGVHWFNPPEWIPGVEVIPSQSTDPAILDRTCNALDGLGKTPVVVADSPGFVANRLQYALFTEALACIEEGIATPEQVDQAVRTCFGFRLPFYGPFQIADMAGLDVYTAVYKVLHEGLGPRFAPTPLIQRLVDQGRTGIKSGQGFYDYTDADGRPDLTRRDHMYSELANLLEQHDAL